MAVDVADDAYDFGGGMLGGFQRFDLKDLAKSADIYSRESGNGVYTPDMLQLIPAWQDQSIVFDTIGSIRVQRAVFAYSDFISLADYADVFKESPIKHRLLKGGTFCFGASLPFIQVQSSGRYEVNRVLSAEPFKGAVAAVDQKIERLRVELFDQIGLVGNVWDHKGIGDVSIYAGIESHTEYFLRLRSLDVAFLFGALLPTGMQRDQKCPVSIPLSLSSVGFNIQTYLELGLKDYLHMGFMSGLMIARAKHHEMRLPVYQEPSAFSPLLTHVYAEPGLTGWLNPYFKISNIANNLHLTVNYACVWHGQDKYDGDRVTRPVQSVLMRNVDSEPYGTTKSERDAAIKKFYESTAWSSRHIGLAFTYEPYQADKYAKINPLLSVGFQMSHKGSNIPKLLHLFGLLTLQF